MIWLARDDEGREACCLEVMKGCPFVNDEGGGNGGDVDGNDGERGERVRGRDVREILKDSLAGEFVSRDVGLRSVLLPSPPEDVRTKGLRFVPGGCSVNVGWRFVGDAIRLN